MSGHHFLSFVCVCCRSIHRKWPRAVFGLSPARTAMKMRTCSAVSLSPSALRDPVSPCLRSCTLLHTHVCSRDCLAQLSDWMSHIIVRRSVHVTICSLLWLPLRNNRYVDTIAQGSWSPHSSIFAENWDGCSSLPFQNDLTLISSSL